MIKTVIRIDNQATLDNVLSLIRNRTPYALGRELKITSLNLGKNFHFALPIEGRETSKHNVQENAKRPNVHLFCIASGGNDDLGCDIVECTHLCGHALSRRKFSRHGEVEKLHTCLLQGAFLRQEKTFGLNVTMTNPHLVEVLHGRGGLIAKPQCDVFRKRSVCNQPIKELTTQAALEHHEDMRVVLECLVESHNIRVIKFPDDVDLVPQLRLRVHHGSLVHFAVRFDCIHLRGEDVQGFAHIARIPVVVSPHQLIPNIGMVVRVLHHTLTAPHLYRFSSRDFFSSLWG
mmetsp:Transcript_120514/g.209167  ORF Transcript_120514/g.209167 Transcript_120514/m.209167 type:complete len:289 (-) Transcript_120514:373-1239(-)